MTLLSQAVLKTLAYADIFDFPLRIEEIARFLILSSEIDLEKIQRTIFLLKKEMIGEKNGFYFLKGREKTVLLRQRREKWSYQKLRIGRRIGYFLRIIPWIRAILVTGALACKNVDKEDDIDWLIITDRNRLWLSRLFSILILQILRVRRRPNQQKAKDKICLNMFLSEDNLFLPLKERNLFTAHEILQSQPLWERKRIYLAFIKANSWTKKYLANAYAVGLQKPKTPSRWPACRRGRLDRLLEGEIARRPRLLRGGIARMINLLESLAFRFQLRYMKPRRTIEKIESGRALFHPQNVGKWVMKEYREKLEKLGIKN